MLDVCCGKLALGKYSSNAVTSHHDVNQKQTPPSSSNNIKQAEMHVHFTTGKDPYRYSSLDMALPGNKHWFFGRLEFHCNEICICAFVRRYIYTPPVYYTLVQADSKLFSIMFMSFRNCCMDCLTGLNMRSSCNLPAGGRKGDRTRKGAYMVYRECTSIPIFVPSIQLSPVCIHYTTLHAET